MKFENENLDYNTLKIYNNEDGFVFIEDLESLKEFSVKINLKICYVTLLFKNLLFLEILGNFVYSYYCFANLKFNRFTFENNAKKIRLKYALFFVYVFLFLGFFVLAFLVLKKANKNLFKICEIVLLMKLLTDLIFSIFKFLHLLFVAECIINFLFLKYLRFLHSELNKIKL
jgi:hypothetical protein